ncbi:MAG TPA: hypothetical protein VLA98_11155 [Solirubrobacteraceae bacterium]|nr:hypothetical protein [Solirubrobacteraceae bacterium]HSD79018.1 hypothetical protein [Solirubrobacteraceae bacterium]
MAADPDTPRQDRRTSVERLLTPAIGGERGGGPLSSRTRQTQRSVEAYLKAGVRPRWMERLAEVDGGIARERRRLERAYQRLRAECGRDGEAFARRWEAVARAWRFDALNELIEQHNAWYPVERDLPMDPRTRDYVPIHGRSYRRPVLGPEWVLAQFPPHL